MNHELRDLIAKIFEEENKTSCNYLVKSDFWFRKTYRGGCNSGDQYSCPNIEGIATAIEKLYKK